MYSCHIIALGPAQLWKFSAHRFRPHAHHARAEFNPVSPQKTAGAESCRVPTTSGSGILVGEVGFGPTPSFRRFGF